MSGFSIRKPVLHHRRALMAANHRPDQPRPDAGRSVSGLTPRGRRRDVLHRDAAGTNRDRHHRPLRAVLHARRRDRSHGVAIAARRQRDQGVLPAGTSADRMSARSRTSRWPICAACRRARCRRSCRSSTPRASRQPDHAQGRGDERDAAARRGQYTVRNQLAGVAGASCRRVRRQYRQIMVYVDPAKLRRTR